jgi:hypothetical protein
MTEHALHACGHRRVLPRQRVGPPVQLPALRPPTYYWAMNQLPAEFPGHELVSAGLVDLAAGRETEASLLVAMAAPRLRALGFAVPPSLAEQPGHRLRVGAATMIVLWVLAGSTARAVGASVVLNAAPQTDTAQAIGYLNAQRAANGIPGDLINDAPLSEGCEQLTNLYQFKPGQYPHRELESQPGYTAAGAEAASSDQGGPPGDWSATANPWQDAPLHLESLFDPGATTAWYGETHGKWGTGRTCMGTARGRSFASPTFFSVPGDKTSGTDPSEVAAEEPFTPGMAVGIPSGTETGPTILMWAEGTDAILQGASLRDAHGAPVPVRVVTASTPAPMTPPGWPPWTGGVGGNFVIPTAPLSFASQYSLTAVWSDSAGRTLSQNVSFETAVSARAVQEREVGDVHCQPCAHGYLKASVARGKVRIAIAPAAHQSVFLTMWRGKFYCVVTSRPCPRPDRQLVADVLVKRTVHMTGASAVIPLPKARGGRGFEVGLVVGRFSALGYQWPGGQALRVQGTS